MEFINPEIIKQINDMGFTTILAVAALLFVLSKMFPQFQPFRKLQDGSTPKEEEPKKKESNDESKYESIDSQRINACLYDVIVRTKSNRVYLALYHNGLIGAPNHALTKVSIINEVVLKNSVHIKRDFHNINKNFISYITEKLDKDGFCFVNNMEELYLDNYTALYNFFVERNVYKAYFFPVMTIDNVVSGFIGVEYEDNNISIVTVEQMVTALHDNAIKLQMLVGYNEPVILQSIEI